MKVLTWSRRGWLVLPGIAVLAAVAVFAAPSLLRTADPDAETIRHASDIGAARALGTETAAVMVGEVAITEADLDEQRAIVLFNQQVMRIMIAEEPAQSPGREPTPSDIQERLALIERHGGDAVGLAASLVAAAVHARATAEGYEATDAELEQFTAEQRRLAELDAGPVRTFEAYVDQIGEDRFWAEVAPRQFARELARQKAFAAVVEGVSDSSKTRDAWVRWERDAVASVQIDVLSPSALGNTTLDQALAYLRDLWEFEFDS